LEWLGTSKVITLGDQTYRLRDLLSQSDLRKYAQSIGYNPRLSRDRKAFRQRGWSAHKKSRRGQGTRDMKRRALLELEDVCGLKKKQGKTHGGVSMIRTAPPIDHTALAFAKDNLISLNFDWEDSSQTNGPSKFPAKAQQLKTSLVEKARNDQVHLPPSGPWLLLQMQNEWFTDDLRVHWNYVHTIVPRDVSKRELAPGDNRDKDRGGWQLEDFQATNQAQAAELTMQEIVALRLYTGPGYNAINKSLRKGDITAFAATTYCIESAIIKLAATSTDKHLVYRGLKGQMPSHLFQGYLNDNSFCVSDSAFISTTKNIEVALGDKYGGNILFALRCQAATIEVDKDKVVTGNGWLKCGADISWISQFPEEEEVLFPRYSGLSFCPRQLRYSEWDAEDKLRATTSAESVFEFTVEYHFNAKYMCPHLDTL